VRQLVASAQQTVAPSTTERLFERCLPVKVPGSRVKKGAMVPALDGGWKGWSDERFIPNCIRANFQLI
jgi:hypothetical protein